MVSQTVIDQLGNQEGFEFLGEKPLKGRAPMAVYGWNNLTACRSNKGGSS
jgi:hypothetical protein